MIDPVQHLSDTARNGGDIMASIGTVAVLVSHVAAIATPILTFLIALLTLAWWALRFWDKFTKRKGE